ncbi:hypothetical protein VARIO8X_120215 [Burkholderiales bacterium 8X]|nr:hypothetical protein VARIO8X_120215 [Burkholderiales bacterium 8X]
MPTAELLLRTNVIHLKKCHFFLNSVTFEALGFKPKY